MTTTRRTAKITPATALIAKATRGYVAIRIDYLASDEIYCVANKDMDIQGTDGATVHINQGQAFYCVRSASLADSNGEHNMFYIVFTDVFGKKHCSCPAIKPCKHELKVGKKMQKRLAALIAKEAEAKELRTLEAVEKFATLPAPSQEDIDNLASIIDEATWKDWPDFVPTWKKQRPPATPAPKVPLAALQAQGSLNGQRGFSLMR